MSPKEKIEKAIEIFKAKFPGVTGLRAYNSEANANEVDFMGEDGLYCIINIRSRAVKGV